MNVLFNFLEKLHCLSSDLNVFCKLQILAAILSWQGYHIQIKYWILIKAAVLKRKKAEICHINYILLCQLHHL